jgi:chaperonin GroEL (HSP60 family)
VADLLREGASEDDRPSLRAQQLEAARWLVDFCAPGYGPGGGSKLVVTGDESRWVRSPALALREAGVGALAAPYADLAKRVHQHGGDGGTTAVLLAARLVAAALDGASPAPPAWLEGYRLAGRQARAWLAAHAAPCRPEDAVASVAPEGWAAVAVQGVGRLATGRAVLELDDVEVRAEPDGPLWLDGVAIAPKDPPPRESDCGVLLLAAPWSAKPRAEGTVARVRSPAALAGFAAAEDGARRRAAGHLSGLGVGLLVCTHALDEGLRGMLLDATITVWTDAPKGALHRLASATGAAPVGRLEEADATDIGQGRLLRRPRGRGWMVRGAGPSATFIVPGQAGLAADEAVEAGERLLRAVGVVLPDPRALPGGGRWQRGLAASLRAAADAAPGKQPIGMRAAAAAVDALADDLLRNAGRDALEGGLLAGADSVLDPAACVRLAVDGAFETAIVILRLDGAYARRPSSAAGLRGGTARSGSPKGMPGDIPPLM